MTARILSFSSVVIHYLQKSKFLAPFYRPFALQYQTTIRLRLHTTLRQTHGTIENFRSNPCTRRPTYAYVPGTLPLLLLLVLSRSTCTVQQFLAARTNFFITVQIQYKYRDYRYIIFPSPFARNQQRIAIYRMIHNLHQTKSNLSKHPCKEMNIKRLSTMACIVTGHKGTQELQTMHHLTMAWFFHRY